MSLRGAISSRSTDILGLGGFINVPIRLVDITAEVEADGRLVGTRNVLPRAGWLTVVQVRPTALPFD